MAGEDAGPVAEPRLLDWAQWVYHDLVSLLFIGAAPGQPTDNAAQTKDLHDHHSVLILVLISLLLAARFLIWLLQCLIAALRRRPTASNALQGGREPGSEAPLLGSAPPLDVSSSEDSVIPQLRSADQQGAGSVQALNRSNPHFTWPAPQHHEQRRMLKGASSREIFGADDHQLRRRERMLRRERMITIQ